MVDKAGASFVGAGPSASKAGTPGATPPPLPTAVPRQVDPHPPEHKRLGPATPLSPVDAGTPFASGPALDPSRAPRARELFRGLADLTKASTQPARLTQLVDRLVNRAAEKSAADSDEVSAMAEGLCQGLLDKATGLMSDDNLVLYLGAVFARAGRLPTRHLALLVAAAVRVLGADKVPPRQLGLLMDRLLSTAPGDVPGKEMAQAIVKIGAVLGGRAIPATLSALMFDRIARCPADDEKMFWTLTGHWSIQLDMGAPGGALEAIRSHFAHLQRTGAQGAESLYRTALALLGPLPDKVMDSASQRRASMAAIMDGIEAAAPGMEPRQAQDLLAGFLIALKSSRMAEPLERGIILQRITGLLPRVPPAHAANLAAALLMLFHPAPADGRPGWTELLEALVDAMARQTAASSEAVLQLLASAFPVVMADERRGDQAMSQLYEVARGRALAEARRPGAELATQGLKLARNACAARLRRLARDPASRTPGEMAGVQGQKTETPEQQAWEHRLQELYSQWTAAGRATVARSGLQVQLRRVDRLAEILQSEMESLEQVLPQPAAQRLSGDLLIPIGHLIDESTELARREGKARGAS